VRFVPQRTLGCFLGLWSFETREIPLHRGAAQMTIAKQPIGALDARRSTY